MNYLHNENEFFAHDFFNDEFTKNLRERASFSPEALKAIGKIHKLLYKEYFEFKKRVRGTKHIPQRILLTHEWHGFLLEKLGYTEKPYYQNPDTGKSDQLFQLDEQFWIPIRNLFSHDGKTALMVMEMAPMVLFAEDQEVPGLHQQTYRPDDWREVFQIPKGAKLSPDKVDKAINELLIYSPEELRPAHLILLAGNKLFLFNHLKLSQHRYLVFDIELLLAGEPEQAEAFGLLLHREALAPDAGQPLVTQMVELGHRLGQNVTESLKHTVVEAIQTIANATLDRLRGDKIIEPHQLDDRLAEQLRDDALNLVYRLLFLFFAEARPEMELLPLNDKTYNDGYSLEKLRSLETVKLRSDSARTGTFFHQSLKLIFKLLREGYPPDAQAALGHEGLILPRLDSPLFLEEVALPHGGSRVRWTHQVLIHNHAWQKVIEALSLSDNKSRFGRSRISYRKLRINQLGSVYESLLAFRGQFAHEELIFVHPKGRPDEERLIAPRSKFDSFHPDEILRMPQSEQPVVIPEGQFVYHLSGRDRQRSASYYTPEELTKATVRYALKQLTQQLDSGEIGPERILRMNILEPAMGAGAFLNEALDQLAELYLKHSEKTRGKIEPAERNSQFYRVKAYLATNRVYGIDINPTAIELGKLALWLNTLQKDLPAPFFAHRLAAGNALLGARLAYFELDEFKDSGTAARRVSFRWFEHAPKTFRLDQPPADQLFIFSFLLPSPEMADAAKNMEIRANWAKSQAGADEKAAKARLKNTELAEKFKPFCEAISDSERQSLALLSRAAFLAFQDHAREQQRWADETQAQFDFHGWTSHASADPLDYKRKEQILRERSLVSSAYSRLKILLDLWAAFWFWPIDRHDSLPTRAYWWQLAFQILKPWMPQAIEQVNAILQLQQQQKPQEPDPKDRLKPQGKPSFDKGPAVLSMERIYGAAAATEKADAAEQTRRADLDKLRQQLDQIGQQAAGEAQTLFAQVDALATAQEIARKMAFFHPELEFVEVFAQGGFDLILGNPPWVKLEFDQTGIIGERQPEVIIQKFSAKQVQDISQESMAQDPQLKQSYFEELALHLSSSAFLGHVQNYPLLQGQQTNLYKAFISRGLDWLAPQGRMGLVHPLSIFNDPNGKELRKSIYPRLDFQFVFTQLGKKCSKKSQF